MNVSPLLAVLVLAGLVWIVSRLWRDNAPRSDRPSSARPLVNDAEREMFGRLRQAFPEAVVHAKVSLAALISVPITQRDHVRHRHVDFVLCDPALNVLAVVQLEQAEELQAFRTGESAAALLSHAGYPVLTWSEPPAVEELVDALSPIRKAGPVRLRTDAYAPKASSD